MLVVLIIGPLSTLGVVWCSAERPELVVEDDDEHTEFAELDIFSHRSSDLIGNFRAQSALQPLKSPLADYINPS